MKRRVVQVAPGLYAVVSEYSIDLLPSTYIERVLADDPSLRYHLIKYYRVGLSVPAVQVVAGPSQAQTDFSVESVGRLVGQAQVYVGSGLALVVENYVYSNVPDAIKLLGVIFDWLERTLRELGVERVFVSAEEPEYDPEFWRDYLEARGYRLSEKDKSYYYKSL